MMDNVCPTVIFPVIWDCGKRVDLIANRLSQAKVVQNMNQIQNSSMYLLATPRGVNE